MRLLHSQSENSRPFIISADGRGGLPCLPPCLTDRGGRARWRMVDSTVGGGIFHRKCQLLPISNPIGNKLHMRCHIYKSPAHVKQTRDWVTTHFGVSKMAVKLNTKEVPVQARNYSALRRTVYTCPTRVRSSCALKRSSCVPAIPWLFS